MEFTNLETPIVNINFNDVMQVIASNDTKPTEKMVYIYLLNVIMDMDEKIQDINNKLEQYEKKNVD